MTHVTVMYDGNEWVRVSKPVAHKAYDSGQSVAITARNLHPFNYWGTTSIYAGGKYGCTPFENVVNAFEYYNCINSETGKYAAFYIRQQ